MTALTRVARTIAHADHDTLFVKAIAGLTLVVASTLIVHYGSFSRILAAIGLAPAG
jgi:hypothetical protein